MTTTNTLFHKTITDPTANSVNFIGLTIDERRQLESFGYKNCNHIAALNATDKDLWLELNNNSNERYPLLANTGRVVISRDDMVFFDSVHILELAGANATGTVSITFGGLPK